MSYRERIRACNTYDLSRFIPFVIGSCAVGWVNKEFAKKLSNVSMWISADAEMVTLQADEPTFEARSEALRLLSETLKQKGLIERIHGEPYPVAGERRDEPMALIDRASAPYFGIRAYGQHLNGYVGQGRDMAMWIGRRAQDKGHAPGKLDQIVAGGLPYGISLQENLLKECDEEANIPRELALQAQPVGTVTYCAERAHGLKPDTLFCYDLELPADFLPRCNDGEVDEFLLLPVDEVAALVFETTEFKMNCNLVIIDFLIRHGILGPDEPDYSCLVSALHPVLPRTCQ